MATKVPIEFIGDLAGLKSDLEGMKSYIGGWGMQIKQVLATEAFKLFEQGIRSATAAITDSVKEATEAARANAKLEAVIKATGNSAGFTAKQMEGMAHSLMAVAGVDDDIIVNAQAILATFREIKGDEFKEATKAALDMSAVLGGDLQGSAMMLGKALNDPVHGITALTRAGVSFTEEQKEMIKSLAETGQVAKAQQMILDELKHEFGGASEAMANAAGHGLGRFSLMIKNVKEDIGTALLPTLDKLFDTMGTKMKPVLDELTTKFGEWISGIDGKQVDTFADAIVQLTKEFGTMANTIASTVLPVANELLKWAQDLVHMLPGADSTQNRLGSVVDTLDDQQFGQLTGAMSKASRASTFWGKQGAIAELGWENFSPTNSDELNNLQSAVDARLNRKTKEIQEKHEKAGLSEAPTPAAAQTWGSIGDAIKGKVEGAFDPFGAGLQNVARGPLGQGWGNAIGWAGVPEETENDKQLKNLAQQAVREDFAARKDKGFNAAVESGESMWARIAGAAASKEPIEQKQLTVQERMAKLMEEEKTERAEVKRIFEAIRDKKGVAVLG